MVGLACLGRLSSGMRNPSIGFLFRYSTCTAARRIEDSTSLIFEIVGCDTLPTAMLEKYSCSVRRVRSRKQTPPNLGSRYFAIMPRYEFCVLLESSGRYVGM